MIRDGIQQVRNSDLLCCRRIMEYLLNSSQAKAVDTFTIQTTGIPSLVLMERASLAVAGHVRRMADCMNGHDSLIVSVCGTGNNGGDGIAAARILYCMGYRAAVLLTGDQGKLSADASKQLEIARRIGLTVFDESRHLPDNTEIIIDAVFGIGLTRDVTGSFADRIREINSFHEHGCKVCAVDIASGIHTDTGAVMGTAVNADITVTFGYKKSGMMLYPGHLYSGEIFCEDIGFDPAALKAASWDWRTYTEADLERLPVRRPDSNKGTYGKVLVIAGSRNMAGAACFSAQAAYRTGCGLVTVYTPECNRVILQEKVPEAVLKTYDEEEEIFEDLEGLLGGHHVVVIGPGLGKSKTSRLLLKKTLKAVNTPVIIDADALNIIAEDKQILCECSGTMILTPHLMELSRLTGYNIQELKENLRQICEDFTHQFGVICISKDARTIVIDPSGQCYLNTSGNHGMSTGGSGDALTGIIAGLAAQGMPAYDASEMGVFVHGLAGDAAAAQMGCRSMTAGDLVAGISRVLRHY